MTVDNDLYFKLLDLVDELLGFRNRLSNLLKTAFLDLSTTKYQIGPENITRMQYDKRMKSNWKLESSDNGLIAATQDCNQRPDPIEWFGLLTPQSLRKAQGGFSAVVGVLVEIANLDAQIKRVECKILLQASRQVA